MDIDSAKLDETLASARARLLAMATPEGHWVGELSASALSTATAAFALATIDNARGAQEYGPHVGKAFAWLVAHQNTDGGWGDTADSPSNISTTLLAWAALGMREGSDAAIQAACASALGWLTREARSGTGVPPVSSCVDFGRKQADGNHGRDAHATTTHGQDAHATAPELARAVYARYGNDRSFSAPILTMCALAGRLGAGREAWRWVAPLPFELAACPHRWLGRLGLPVVSYALPALIAIGQARFVHRPPVCPLTRLLRGALRKRTLAILASAQPLGGGFLEAAPLTSFVAMSLASIGLADHAVVRRAAQFLISTVRPDGSWAIDTNMATWVTTLAVNALADADSRGATGGTAVPLADMGPAKREHIIDWLLGQQLPSEHPYTHAAPGGWAWTDLSGGVPDADDTAGALLALARMRVAAVPAARQAGVSPVGSSVRSACVQDEETHGRDAHATAKVGRPLPDIAGEAAGKGLAWLIGLQNRDGGIPTFCRGWGKMPFDRSCPDLTAHAIRAWLAWPGALARSADDALPDAIRRAVKYLGRSQREDGSWLPLWFGNQHAPGPQNPVYGTSRVVAALVELHEGEYPAATAMLQRASAWLIAAQNGDGGWGAEKNVASSIEETALAVDALARTIVRQATPVCASRLPDKGRDPRIEIDDIRESLTRGVNWLIDNTRRGEAFAPSPIGLYFASLWYSQSLYPIIFTVAALAQARKTL